jgi:hypothetical protein
MTERTPEQIEQEIEQARERLSGTVEQIVTKVHPANVAQRGLNAVRAQFVEPDGTLRTARVAVAGSLLVALVGLKLWRRGR